MACVTGGEPRRAVDLLEQMKRARGGVNGGPDIVTYTTAISACGGAGEGGEKVFVTAFLTQGIRCKEKIR